MRMNEAAATGFQAGAAEYERARPSYPHDAVDFMAAVCELKPGKTVLDLAAGTGKLTRLLRPFAARLVAAEPVEAMREGFRGVLPKVPLVAATAEYLPFPAGSLDAVVVGQAFHWFDAPVALEELHRALRPRGALALIWNVRDDSDPLNAGLTALVDRYEPPGAVRVWRGDWKAPLEAATSFEPIERKDFRYTQTLDPAGVVGRMLSVSYIATQPGEVRSSIEREVLSLVGDGKSIELPYRTELYWTRARA